jgi:hypothetical protein
MEKAAYNILVKYFGIKINEKYGNNFHKEKVIINIGIQDTRFT